MNNKDWRELFPKVFELCNITTKQNELIQNFIENKKIRLILSGNHSCGKYNLMCNIIDRLQINNIYDILDVNIYSLEPRKKFIEIIECYFKNISHNKKIIISKNIELLPEDYIIIIQYYLQKYDNIQFIFTTQQLEFVHQYFNDIGFVLNMKQYDDKKLNIIVKNICETNDIVYNKKNMNILIQNTNYSLMKIIMILKKFVYLNEKITITNMKKYISFKNDILCKVFEYIKNKDYVKSSFEIYKLKDYGMSITDIFFSLYDYLDIILRNNQKNKKIVIENDKINKYKCLILFWIDKCNYNNNDDINVYFLLNDLIRD